MARISRCDYTNAKQITYSFEANWSLNDQMVSWDATIWRGGQVVGSQGGVFRDRPSKDVSNLVGDVVRANLEAGIEHYHRQALLDS